MVGTAVEGTIYLPSETKRIFLGKILTTGEFCSQSTDKSRKTLVN